VIVTTGPLLEVLYELLYFGCVIYCIVGEIYFCKPGKELDSKIEDLGGKKIHPLGLGITLT
jgi:hypothetical protein